MTDLEDLDPRLTARIRTFADEATAGFDPERVAAVAMARGHRRRVSVLITVVAAVVAAVIGVAGTSALVNNRPVGQGPVTPLATDVVSSPSQSAPCQPSLSPSASSPVPSATSTPSQSAPIPTQTPVPSPGLTEEEAIAVARAAAPHAADFPVTRAEAGLASELVHEPALDLPTLPAPERLVWVIVLAGGPTQNQEISVVVIDFLDGHVYGVLDLIG